MGRFVKIFFFSLLIFTVLMSSVIKFFMMSGWMISIINGLAIGVIFSAILVIVLYLLTHFVRYSKPAFYLVVLLISLTSAITGYGLYWGLDHIPVGSWQEFPIDLQEKAVDLVGYYGFELWEGKIYFKTESGNLYELSCSSETPCKLTRLESMPDTQQYSREDCPPAVTTFKPPRAPQGVKIDQLEILYCGPDYTNQTNLLLYNDGSLWYWGRYSPVSETLVILAGGMAGLLTGLLSSLTLLIGRKEIEVW